MNVVIAYGAKTSQGVLRCYMTLSRGLATTTAPARRNKLRKQKLTLQQEHSNKAVTTPTQMKKKQHRILKTFNRKGSSSSSHTTAAAAKPTNMTTTQKGDILEQRVAKILKNEGRSNIKTKVFLKDANGNRSEIDVCYGRLFKTYVECKNYFGRPVPLHDVAKFKEVLQLNNIPLSRGVFVTSSTYSPRATTIGVITVDGKQLIEWEKASQRRARKRMIRYLVCSLVAVVTFMIHQAPFLVEVFGLEKTLTGSYWLKAHEFALSKAKALEHYIPQIVSPQQK